MKKYMGMIIAVILMTGFAGASFAERLRMAYYGVEKSAIDTKVLNTDRNITDIVIHHTATRDDLTSEEMELSMKRTRVENRGMDKIPTHYIIDKWGSFTKVNDPSLQVGAIHESGDQHGNTHGVHIELVGDFNQGKPTTEQYRMLNTLIGWIQDRYPMAVNIRGHKDYQPKNCPGVNFDFCEIDAFDGQDCQKKYIGKGKVTTYKSYPGGACSPGNINCSGDSLQPAWGGHRYDSGQEEKYVACDPMYKFGTQFKLVNKQLGERTVTCVDRGGAIKGETRFDLWLGIDGNLSRRPTTFYDVDVYRISG